MRDLPEVLFVRDNLDGMLREKLRRAVRMIEDLPQLRFRGSSDEEILEQAYAEATVEPIELDLENQVVDYGETDIDTPLETAGESGDHDPACLVQSVKVVVATPFTGDRSLFAYRPSNFDLYAPTACIRGGTDGDPRPTELVIEYAVDRARDPGQYKRKADGIISHIQTYLFHVNGQVSVHNQNLRYTLHDAISTRRKELAK